MDFAERVRRRNEFDASLVYGTRKFNLMTGRKEHTDYREKNDDRWTDPGTGIIYPHFARKRPCPLCDADDYQALFVKNGFPHVKCRKCDFVYVNPILNGEEYAKLYRAEDSWERVLETDAQIEMQRLEADYNLDIAELYLEKGADTAICDVGCGPGTLLARARERGYHVMGIEPNRRCHPLLEEKNIPFIGDFFPLPQPPDRLFDCVFFMSTLEHLPNPREILFEIRKLLKPGGLIYISVPNIDALVTRIMHEKSGVFGGHSHIGFFNNKTLAMLLEKTGFRVLEFETVITEVGVLKNYLSFQSPYFGTSQDDLGFITPEMIYKNHLARSVNIVGRLA